MAEPDNIRFTGIGTFAPMTLVLVLRSPAPDLWDLLSCVEQQRMWPAELLIVDRGCSAVTVAGLHRWVPPPGVTVKVVDAPGVSIAHARNLAVESAHYDHIAVADLGVHLHRDWLAEVWRRLGAGADAVTGLIEPVGRTLLQRAIGVVRTPSPGEIDLRTFLPQGGPVAFSKTIWDGVAGYPEWLESGHDHVFALTLRQSGAVIALIPETIGSARSPETLPRYLTDCWHTGNAAGRAGVTTRPGITAAVLAGCTIIAALKCQRSTGLFILAGLSAHLRVFLKRVWLTRKDNNDGKDPFVARLTTVAGVVLIGDTTRIAGYLAGLTAAARTHSEDTVRSSGRRRPADQDEWAPSTGNRDAQPAAPATGTGDPRSGSSHVGGAPSDDRR